MFNYKRQKNAQQTNMTKTIEMDQSLVIPNEKIQTAFLFSNTVSIPVWHQISRWFQGPFKDLQQTWPCNKQMKATKKEVQRCTCQTLRSHLQVIWAAVQAASSHTEGNACSTSHSIDEHQRNTIEAITTEPEVCMLLPFLVCSDKYTFHDLHTPAFK